MTDTLVCTYFDAPSGRAVEIAARPYGKLTAYVLRMGHAKPGTDELNRDHVLTRHALCMTIERAREMAVSYLVWVEGERAED